MAYDLRNPSGYLDSGTYPLTKILFYFVIASAAIVGLCVANIAMYYKAATALHRIMVFLPAFKVLHQAILLWVLKAVNRTGVVDVSRGGGVMSPLQELGSVFSDDLGSVHKRLL